MMKIKKETYDRAKEVNVIADIFKENRWLCHSNGSKNEWEVTEENNILFCNCPSREKPCKHITAVMISENRPFEVEGELTLEVIKLICKKCQRIWPVKKETKDFLYCPKCAEKF